MDYSNIYIKGRGLNYLHPMLQGAHVVNVGRGGLLDYDAVMAALESGHLGGLGIDVAWTEPFDPSDPLLKYPNVLITPHIAGVTTFSYQSMSKVCLHTNDFLLCHVILNERKFGITSQKILQFSVHSRKSVMQLSLLSN